MIDSNAEDVRLFLETIESKSFSNGLSTVASGSKALDLIHQCGADPDCTRPNLVVLDIDLPEMNWQTLFETFDTDPEWNDIPVIVFTELGERELVAQAYAHHASAYVERLVARDKFIDVVHSIDKFWFDAVWLLPRGETEDDS